MKELSIEEKAKRYDLAIEAAKSIYNNMEEGGNFSGIEDLEVIFPELAKSEDEKMFKAIAEGIRDEAEVFGWSDFGDIPIDDILAWLEKQREKTSDKIVEKARTEKQRVLLTETDGNANIDWDCRSINDVKILLKCGLEFIRNIESNKQILTDNRFGGCSFSVPTRYDEGINQGEQKPADKVEPKFMVGDWITDNNSTFQIVRIENEWYYTDDGDKICFDVAHQYYRLWTIEDAQDGDVLATEKGNPFIYDKNRYNNGLAYYYVGLGVNKELTLKSPHNMLSHFGELCSVFPATEEQRNLLFQKMKEKNYRWENNKLEEISDEGFVDLGLPSGTLWAKCNLGAEKETDFGLFFQWGDTQGYKGVDEHQFNWNDYKYSFLDNITKYNEADNKLVLENEDDPVFVATNGMVKMPTKDRLQELIDHTNHEWAENFEGSGVNGMKFTNKKDATKYIFIPASGFCGGSHHNVAGSWGYVWSTSRDESNTSYAWNMTFGEGYIGKDYFYRSDGFSVRGVLNK